MGVVMEKDKSQAKIINIFRKTEFREWLTNITALRNLFYVNVAENSKQKESSGEFSQIFPQGFSALVFPLQFCLFFISYFSGPLENCLCWGVVGGVRVVVSTFSSRPLKTINFSLENWKFPPTHNQLLTITIIYHCICFSINCPFISYFLLFVVVFFSFYNFFPFFCFLFNFCCCFFIFLALKVLSALYFNLKQLWKCYAFH